MKNKRGQFYLLIALIVITMIAGFILIANYSIKKDYSRVENLAEELKIESGKVLDRGAVNRNYRWDGFTKNFSKYAGRDIDIIYIIANFSIVDVFNYSQSGLKTLVGYTETIDNLIGVNKSEVNYEFQLKPGENFYFIMFQDIEGEKYVSRN